MISGPGAFTLEDGATLRICSGDGITATAAAGNVQVTGPRSYATGATYSYSHSGFQVSGDGLPAEVWRLENDSPSVVGLQLSQPVAVREAVRMFGPGLQTNGQMLTLLSNDQRTAYATGPIYGLVTVQRHISGFSAVGYRHLSSPVQAAPVADLATSGMFGSYAPRVNAAYNALPTPRLTAAQFPNIFGYNETRGGTATAYRAFQTGYYSPASLQDVLTPGRGWSVYIKGGITPDFVGDLNDGDVDATLTVTAPNPSPNTLKYGWNLLGNPYPQPIDWDLAVVPPRMDAAISVYRTLSGNNGQYLTRVSNGDGTGIGSLPDGIVPLGQGFFARASQAVMFTFTNALRVEANPWQSDIRPAASARPQLTLTLGAPGWPRGYTTYAPPTAAPSKWWCSKLTIYIDVLSSGKSRKPCFRPFLWWPGSGH